MRVKRVLLFLFADLSSVDICSELHLADHLPRPRLGSGTGDARHLLMKRVHESEREERRDRADLGAVCGDIVHAVCSAKRRAPDPRRRFDGFDRLGVAEQLDHLVGRPHRGIPRDEGDNPPGVKKRGGTQTLVERRRRGAVIGRGGLAARREAVGAEVVRRINMSVAGIEGILCWSC